MEPDELVTDQPQDDLMTTGQEEDAAARDVTLEEESPVDLSVVDDQSPNLVPFYMQSEEGEKFLEDLGRQVKEDFQRAWDSSETYRGKREENYRIMTGFLQTKTLPFDGCANAHAPLMLERLLRLSSNLFAEIFTDHERIFNVTRSGPDDDQTAEILSCHGNWQIKNVITDFVRQQHRGLQEFVSVGSVFCHSYYDPLYQRNRHDILNCEEFVIPYVFTTVEPDLCDVPYKVKILRKYKHELQALEKTNEWTNLEEVLEGQPPEQHEDPEIQLRETAAQSEGIQPADNDPNSPYKFYQYDGWTTLPSQDMQRPIVAIVDSKTQAVVKLIIREEDDWRDRSRFQRETAEWQSWQQETAIHQQIQAHESELRQRLSAPHVDPMERDMLASQLSAQPVPPPPPPRWMKTEQHTLRGPDPIRRIPSEMYSHGVCIENPVGSMGLSYGNILADENKMADEALNRFYDAASLGNCWSVLVPETLEIEKGSIPFGPGKITSVRGVTGDQLRNSIVEFRPGPANTQLVDMVRMAAEWGDGVTVSGVVSGEAGKSGETYRGHASRLERATKQLSVAGLKYLEFLTNILRNNAKLNSVFLADNEMVEVTNDLGLKDLATVNKDMYIRDYRITFTADVRFASQAQKISEADEVVGMIGSMPPLQQNPSFVYAAIKDALVARGKHHLVPLLGPAPPPVQTPMGAPPPPPPGAPRSGGPGGAPPGGAPAPAVPTGAAPGGIPGPKPGPEVQA